MFSVLSATVAQAQWNTHIYGAHSLTAQAEGTTQPDPQVPESSGVVSSRSSPDIFWTHNDSGSGPRVWAFRLSAADRLAGVARRLGYVELTGATSQDWEDIAIGPGPMIYVFDGGDNPPCDRTNKRIHRFVEPVVDPNGAPISLSAAYESIRFEYPDSSDPQLPADSNAERYDAECLMVHPITGDMYVVTKRDTTDTGVARVYKLPESSVTWNSGTVHVLTYVADITTTIGVQPANLETVTAGDIDAFGLRAVIRRYPTAYEFTLPAGQPFDDIFQQTPVAISLSGEVQGEAICYDQAGQGGDLISTSEVVRFLGFPIGPQRLAFYVTPWEMANLRSKMLRTNRATICWDTADTLDSTVDFGTTTGYGQTASDPALVTTHEILLAGLTPGTTYFFRATSGALIFPGAGEASEYSFTTRLFLGPDLDMDNDVDSDDYGLLQICLSGSGVPQTNPLCMEADLDGDGDVDLDDTIIIGDCNSGASVVPDPDCY